MVRPLRGENIVAAILTFKHVARSNVSSLVFFLRLRRTKLGQEDRLSLCFYQSWFQVMSISGARDEINTGGIS